MATQYEDSAIPARGVSTHPTGTHATGAYAATGTTTGATAVLGSDVNMVTAPIKRISWGAVLAGAVVALAVQVLLTMLGTGIGASTIDMGAGGSDLPSGTAFGAGAAAWWVVSSLLALLAGGFVAGRLSGVPRSTEGALHGLLTWAVAVLVIVYLVSSTAGALMRGAAGVLGTAANMTATGVAAAAPKLTEVAQEQLSQSGLSLDSIKQDALKMLSQTGKPELQPGNVAAQAKGAAADAKAAPTEQNLSGLLDKLLTRGKDTASQVDRDAVINVVMARSNVSREEATKQVASWEQTATQARAKAEQTAAEAKQKARQAADASAKAVSRAMLLGALALALGGLVAWWGGAIGQRRTMDTSDTRGTVGTVSTTGVR